VETVILMFTTQYLARFCNFKKKMECQEETSCLAVWLRTVILAASLPCVESHNNGSRMASVGHKWHCCSRLCFSCSS
jgi:hypothetical protein